MIAVQKLLLTLTLLIIVLAVFITASTVSRQQVRQAGDAPQEEAEGGILVDHPLSIAALRNGNYATSEIVVEEKLAPGTNYSRAIVSYESEGNTIYALLTIPQGERPVSGWPVVVFNHGYIPPAEYRTTERYVAYVDGFARNGYIVLRSDYRGHGSSEGEAAGGYGTNAYTIDVLNALYAVKKYPDADPDRIGMWGHSMGGHITLRSMVVDKDIKAGVTWAGVVASYPDLINNWRRGSASVTPSVPRSTRGRWRQALVEQYGEPSDGSPFWQSISANAYLQDVSGPIQLHHGTADTSVPHEFSRKLEQQMEAAGKEVEYYEYSSDDHNLSGNFNTAMQHSIEFFDRHVKGSE